MSNLTKEDINNIILLLDRVEVKGVREAQVLTGLVYKLSQDAKDPKDQDLIQEQPVEESDQEELDS